MLICRVALVAPVRERGLKYSSLPVKDQQNVVAPVRERGLKFTPRLAVIVLLIVAPVRERGLKFRVLVQNRIRHNSRSRKGAWIEMKVKRSIRI